MQRPAATTTWPGQPVAHEPAAGEHREVRRHGVCRDRDRDGVVEHLRPGGEERDGLVEGSAGERRRAAGLGEARRRLRVRRRREREDHARDRERDGRHPPGVERRDAERVVDRRADVAVGRREHVAHAEDSRQAVRGAAAEQRHALPGELPLAQDALRVEAHEHADRLHATAVHALADDERAAERARPLPFLSPQRMLRMVSIPARSWRLGNGCGRRRRTPPSRPRSSLTAILPASLEVPQPVTRSATPTRKPAASARMPPKSSAWGGSSIPARRL